LIILNLQKRYNFLLADTQDYKEGKKILKEKSQSSSLQVAEKLLEGTTLLALDMGTLYTSERQLDKDDQNTTDTTSLLT